ncbi:MAG: sulfatase-like hydrolase/transferase [Planctomycetota bacterium]
MNDSYDILLITTDQMRADCMGCMGHPLVQTPHLDQLARQATLFTRAQSSCPVCIPARTSLITGRTAYANGSPSFNKNHRIQRPRQQLLGGLLTAAGYQTELVGKTHWHLDSSDRAGFEHITSYSGLKRARQRLGTGHHHGIGWNELLAMCSHLPPELNSTHWAIDRSIEILQERDKSQPLFLWTSLIEPHPPTVIHEPYYSMYQQQVLPEPVLPSWSQDDRCPHAIRALRSGNSHSWSAPFAFDQARAVYFGMITHVDHQLGRLFGALISSGRFDKTIIIVTSDHGEFLGDCGTCFKGSVLASAAWVPLIVRLPPSFETQRGSRCDRIVSLEDILPTCCDVADAPIPDDIQGRSLVPLCRNSEATHHEQWHCQIDNQHAFFHDGYKYCWFADDGRELIFDAQRDPDDVDNRSADVALRHRLSTAFAAYLQSLDHPHQHDGKLVMQGTQDIDPGNVMGWMGLADH